MTSRLSTLLLAVSAWTCLAASLGAQEPAPGATLTVEAGLTATSILDEWAGMSGGAVLLHPTPRLTIGGAGWLQNGLRELEPSTPGGGFRLKVSYGGLIAGFRVSDGNTVQVDIRALLGAGNAKIELPATRTEIAADNFVVFEPQVGLTARIAGPMSTRAALGYRFTGAVEDVAGVTSAQLRGISAMVSLAVHIR